MLCKMSTKQQCSVLIARSFGSSFIVNFPDLVTGWKGVLSILNQIELIEGEEPDVGHEWDLNNGLATKKTPLSMSKYVPIEFLNSFWCPGSKAHDYLVGSGNSYQLLVLPGYASKNDTCEPILMRLEEALYYLNNNVDINAGIFYTYS